MNVGLDGGGHLPVDDERDVGHIDTSTGLQTSKIKASAASPRETGGERAGTHEIGRDENLVLSVSQTLQRCFSLLLVFTGVESRCRELQIRWTRVSGGKGNEREDRRWWTNSCSLDVSTDHVSGLLLVAEDDHGWRETNASKNLDHALPRGEEGKENDQFEGEATRRG